VRFGISFFVICCRTAGSFREFASARSLPKSGNFIVGDKKLALYVDGCDQSLLSPSKAGWPGFAKLNKPVNKLHPTDHLPKRVGSGVFANLTHIGIIGRSKIAVR
jgi:hypothetical protein